MEGEPQKTNWLALTAVALSLLGSLALLGYLSIRFLPSNGTQVYSNTAQASTLPPEQAPPDWADDSGAIVLQPAKTKYILHKDIQKQIGRSLLTYRGKTGGSEFKLDVVVLDLDPHATYKNTIDIARAKQSFRAGDERLELISAGRLRLRVWHHQ